MILTEWKNFPAPFLLVARVEHDAAHQIQTLSAVVPRIAGVAATTSIEVR